MLTARGRLLSLANRSGRLLGSGRNTFSSVVRPELPFGRAARAELPSVSASAGVTAEEFKAVLNQPLEAQELEEGARQAYEALVAAINRRDEDAIRAMCTPQAAKALIAATAGFKVVRKTQAPAPEAGPPAKNNSRLQGVADRLDGMAGRAGQQAAHLKGAPEEPPADIDEPALRSSEWVDTPPSQPDYMRDLLDTFDPQADAERAATRIAAETSKTEFQTHPEPKVKGGPAGMIYRMTGVDLTLPVPLVDLHTSLDLQDIRETVEARADENPRAAADLERWDRLRRSSFDPELESLSGGDTYFRPAIQLRQKLTGEQRSEDGAWPRLATHEREWMGKLSQAARVDFHVPGELIVPGVSDGSIFLSDNERKRFADRVTFLSTVMGLPGFVNEPSWDAMLFQLTVSPVAATVIQTFLHKTLRDLGLLKNPRDMNSLETVPVAKEEFRWFPVDMLMYPGMHMAGIIPTAPMPLPGVLYQTDPAKAGFFERMILKRSPPRFRRLNLFREFAVGVISRMTTLPGQAPNRSDPTRTTTLMRPDIRDPLVEQIEKMSPAFGRVYMLAPEAFDVWFDSLDIHPEAVKAFLPLEWQAAQERDGDFASLDIGRIHPSALALDHLEEGMSAPAGARKAGVQLHMVHSRVLQSRLRQLQLQTDGRSVAVSAAAVASDADVAASVEIVASEHLETSQGIILDGPYARVVHDLTLLSPLRRQGASVEMDWAISKLDNLP